MHGIQIASTGGSEVLTFTEIPDPVAAPGEVIVSLEASGVNFIDVYQRTGLYPLPLPAVLGMEGAGVVLSLGPGVETFTVGDRVAFAQSPGAYAEQVAVPADRLVAVPDGLDARVAAAVMLQGLTAHYLVHATYPLGGGETCLIHAGAGGVGLLLIQMARRLGATVITTVGTAAKGELARAAGADHVIVYTKNDFALAVEEIMHGVGLDVVYDSVGVDTFDRGLRLLRPRGMMVLFGQASGPVPPFDLGRLGRGGSLYVTRPTLGHYVTPRSELLSRSEDLFAGIDAGELDVRIGAEFPLSEAARAHEALEGRATTGKVLLIP